MTTKETAVRAAAAIDFTMMYVTHGAFRRDLGHLKVAATSGKSQSNGQPARRVTPPPAKWEGETIIWSPRRVRLAV